MSVGSKVVLLVSLGFIGLLIWYYGGTPEVAVAKVVPAVQPESAPSTQPGAVVDRSTANTAKATTVTTTSRAAPRRPRPPASSLVPPKSPQEERLMGGPEQPHRPLTTTNPPPPAPTVASIPPAPVSSTHTHSKPPASSPRKHVVQSGDTLTEIAERYYGSHRLWTVITTANPGLDPDRLRLGQVLVLPPRPPRAQAAAMSPPPASKPVPSGSRTHTVGDGDSLSSIAEQYYGHEKYWTRVFEANNSRLGGNPDRLRIGVVLVVPR